MRGGQRKPRETDSLVTGSRRDKCSGVTSMRHSVRDTIETSIHREREGQRKELRGNPDNPILMNEWSCYTHLIVLWRT